jgi:asparagine synthase (glutamine-hydrolysing)
MSGICGILSQENSGLRERVFERMMRALKKHGPDGSGIWKDDHASLGHQMMHITPESLDEHLPLHHVESQVSLTADARLDNREELSESLGTSLAQPPADSELILAAYLKWGKACADHLVGEFVIAIWDARDRCLHCITDPMGIRPLFYSEVQGQYFAFASEIEALLGINDWPAELNQRRLAMLGISAFSAYLEPESTCFENIFRVPAASVLTVSRAGKTIHEYWTPDYKKQLPVKTDAECKEAFQEVFKKAVKARLRSAFPVASLLSGGLDSSAIVSTASRALAKENRSLVTLSSVPMPSALGQVVDELPFINLFRNVKNLDMQLVSAADARLFDDAQRAVASASLCSYSYQGFLYKALVEKAKDQNARVILDGDGGEHSASCYTRGYFAELLLAARWRTLLAELKRLGPNQRVSFSNIKRQVLRPLFPYPALKLLGRNMQIGHLFAYPVLDGFVQDVLGQETDHIRDQVFRLPKEHANHRRNMVADILLERNDIRMRSHAGFSNYHDVQFSYPFLDKQVLEFCLAVDGRFKHENGLDRRLLRLGMEGQLPEAILSRTSKAPFSPDYIIR